jgi:hypothetical protein
MGQPVPDEPSVVGGPQFDCLDVIRDRDVKMLSPFSPRLDEAGPDEMESAKVIHMVWIDRCHLAGLEEKLLALSQPGVGGRGHFGFLQVGVREE